VTVIPFPAARTAPTSEAADALESNLGLIHKAVATVSMPEAFREDAFQEAAVAFLRHYASFDPARGRLSTFMWPHLRGAVTHFLRSLARRPLYTADTQMLDMRVEFTPDLVDVDVAAFMDSLGATDRRLLTGLYWQDQSLSHVARGLGISRQTAHVRHKRVIARAHQHFLPAETLSA
jgi:RNA polymerase sigma factor (sigma-70 family)